MNFWFTEDEVKKVFQAPYGFKKSIKELRMKAYEFPLPAG